MASWRVAAKRDHTLGPRRLTVSADTDAVQGHVSPIDPPVSRASRKTLPMESPTTVTIEGPDPLELEPSSTARERYGWTSRHCVINCHTGRVIVGRWAGIPLESLIDAGVVPAETTHLLVHGADGHRVCVDIRRALEALLGFVCEEVDRGHDGTTEPDTVDDTPRFLAPDIDSSQAVRNVTVLEPLALEPTDDPREFEYHRRADEG